MHSLLNRSYPRGRILPVFKEGRDRQAHVFSHVTAIVVQTRQDQKALICYLTDLFPRLPGEPYNSRKHSMTPVTVSSLECVQCSICIRWLWHRRRRVVHTASKFTENILLLVLAGRGRTNCVYPDSCSCFPEHPLCGCRLKPL